MKAMQRLRDLAQEHSQHMPSQETLPPILRDLSEEGGEEKEKVCPKMGREQKIIDAVLGLHPCVAIETKEVIKQYASKPTSPATVVNLKKIQRGGNHFFDFAKKSMGKLMNCAADLKDLHDADGLCAWEDGGIVTQSRRGSRRQQDTCDDDNEDDISEHDEGTFKGVSIKEGRGSPVSHLGNDNQVNVCDGVDDDESLEDVMGKLNVNRTPSRVLIPPSEHQYYSDEHPHQSEKSDLDQSEKSDPDRHQSEKLDPDPDQHRSKKSDPNPLHR
jgi:hypothetical protein